MDRTKGSRLRGRTFLARIPGQREHAEGRSLPEFLDKREHAEGRSLPEFLDRKWSESGLRDRKLSESCLKVV